jgi:hypothetical protein
MDVKSTVDDSPMVDKSTMDNNPTMGMGLPSAYLPDPYIHTGMFIVCGHIHLHLLEIHVLVSSASGTCI